jgi:hypothetical protein
MVGLPSKTLVRTGGDAARWGVAGPQAERIEMRGVSLWATFLQWYLNY